jgi:hypothetical protein
MRRVVGPASSDSGDDSSDDLRLRTDHRTSIGLVCAASHRLLSGARRNFILELCSSCSVLSISHEDERMRHEPELEPRPARIAHRRHSHSDHSAPVELYRCHLFDRNWLTWAFWRQLSSKMKQLIEKENEARRLAMPHSPLKPLKEVCHFLDWCSR